MRRTAFKLETVGGLGLLDNGIGDTKVSDVRGDRRIANRGHRFALRRVMGEDKIAIFDWPRAFIAALNYRRVNKGLAVIKLRESPSAGRGIFSGDPPLGLLTLRESGNMRG
jgi:hypothetical protein